MASAPFFVTPEEYLRRERVSQEKHEYIDGQIFAMAGANRRHREIMDNVMALLRSKREESGCRPSNSETRLFVPVTGVYTYADVVLTCGPEQYQDDALDTLLNPTLIVEVLSASTEAYDRGKKFLYYKSIPSFSEYLLIAPDETLIEYFVRLSAREWKQTMYRDLTESVMLEKSRIALPLSAVYENVLQ